MNIHYSPLQQKIIQVLNEENAERMTRYNHAVYEDAINFVNEMSIEDIETIFLAKDKEYDTIKEICLNGAQDAKQWSYGGCGLIYNYDLAKHYCTPSEFKKKREGRTMPAPDKTWLDVQAAAMNWAMWKIYIAVRCVKIREGLVTLGYDRTAA